MRRLLAIALAAAATSAAQTPTQERNGEIGGSVRSAQTGDPLKSARVFLRPQSGSQGLRLTQKTGPAGEFLFKYLPHGNYSLTAGKAGYITREGQAENLTLKNGQKVAGLEIRLPRAAVITGQILDPDGQPVPQAEARAYVVRYRHGKPTLVARGQARSDDLGEYRIFALSPGKYVVGAWPPRGQGPIGVLYADTGGSYYSNARTASEALPLKIGWGQEVTQVDVELADQPGYAVTGTLFDGRTRQPCRDCSVHLTRAEGFGSMGPVGVADVPPTGVFAIRGLTPGVYKIIAKLSDDTADYTVGREVRISNQHLEDIDVALRAGQTVSGTLVFEEAPAEFEMPKSRVSLSASRLIGFWPHPTGTLAESSVTFRIENVPAETYEFRVSPLPAGAYLKALRVYGQKLPGPELTVPRDAPLRGVQAVIAFDGATVSGQVDPGRAGSAKERPIEALVTLLPKRNQSGYLIARAVETAPDGTFSFTAVVPGAYTMYALPSRSTAQVMDPAVQSALRSFARPIDLDAEEKLAVDLPLAPDPEDTY